MERRGERLADIRIVGALLREAFGEMRLCEIRHLATAVAVEDTEDIRVVCELVDDVASSRVAPPALHRRYAELPAVGGRSELGFFASVGSA